MSAALAAEQPCPVSEETPGTPRAEVRRAAHLVGVREPALVDRKEGDDAFPDLLPVFRSNVCGVSCRGAQVQFIATVSTAASRKQITYYTFCYLKENI